MGIKKGESHEETIIREVREEMGYLANNVRYKVGIITERKTDEFQDESVFEMVSHYYLCELNSNIAVQELDDYEAELDFKPVWITLDKEIQANEDILNKNDEDKNPWVYRDNYVLNLLMEQYNKLI